MGASIIHDHNSRCSRSRGRGQSKVPLTFDPFVLVPDFSQNWDLRIHPCVSVRPSVPRILNDYPLYFLKFCMELQLYMGECNILGFLKMILVVSPGALLWLKSPKYPKVAKMILFAS